MSEQKMWKNLRVFGAGIEACIEKKLQLPALTLLYAGMDIVAWLANDDPNAKVGKRFMAWLEQYLLKAKPLACTAADLYAARCGMVHTLTPDSDMSAQGKARRICYAWGDRQASALQEATVRANLDDRFVCVQIEELYEAWRLGVRLLFEEMQCDPARAARVYLRVEKFFDSESTERLDWAIDRLT